MKLWIDATYGTDRTPGEQSCETGEGKKPVENKGALGGQNNVGKTTPHEKEGDGGQRTTRSVDVGEDLGRVSLLGKGGQGSGTTVHTRDTNGNDGDANDKVHEVIVTIETGILGGQDKGRGSLLVGVLGTQETIIGRADQETDKGEAEDVEACGS